MGHRRLSWSAVAWLLQKFVELVLSWMFIALTEYTVTTWHQIPNLQWRSVWLQRHFVYHLCTTLRLFCVSLKTFTYVPFHQLYWKPVIPNFFLQSLCAFTGNLVIHQRNSVFRLFIIHVCVCLCVFVRVWSCTESLWTRDLEDTIGTFTKYTARAVGTEINWLGFEIWSSKIKITVRQMWSERHCGNFEGHGLKGHGHRQPFRWRQQSMVGCQVRKY